MSRDSVRWYQGISPWVSLLLHFSPSYPAVKIVAKWHWPWWHLKMPECLICFLISHGFFPTPSQTSLGSESSKRSRFILRSRFSLGTAKEWGMKTQERENSCVGQAWQVPRWGTERVSFWTWEPDLPRQEWPQCLNQVFLPGFWFWFVFFNFTLFICTFRKLRCFPSNSIPAREIQEASADAGLQM